MKLLIMRHGEAESLQVYDEDRCLTEKGIEQASQTAEWLKEQYGSVDFAMVSPFKRTLQTFFTVKDTVSIGRDVLLPDLIPSGNSDIVHDYIDFELAQEPKIKTVLIVSHMPIVSYLVDALTGVEKSILFPTAGVVTLNYKTSISRGEFLGLHQG